MSLQISMAAYDAQIGTLLNTPDLEPNAENMTRLISALRLYVSKLDIKDDLIARYCAQATALEDTNALLRENAERLQKNVDAQKKIIDDMLLSNKPIKEKTIVKRKYKRNGWKEVRCQLETYLPPTLNVLVNDLNNDGQLTGRLHTVAMNNLEEVSP